MLYNEIHSNQASPAKQRESAMRGSLSPENVSVVVGSVRDEEETVGLVLELVPLNE